MSPIKRIAFTVDEKVALRKQHAQNPELSQKALCKWFEESFGKPIRQGTVGEVLSTRYSHFDKQITPSQAAIIALPCAWNCTRSGCLLKGLHL